VSFSASGSRDPDGSATGYTWEFGDGATASGKTAGHSYAKAGSYAVKLTVTDDQGASGQARGRSWSRRQSEGEDGYRVDVTGSDPD
jgi:chitodextrinase